MIANCLPKPDPPPMYRVLLSFATAAGLLIPAITCDQDATTGQLGWSDRVQSIDASWNRFHLVRALLSRSMRTRIVMIPFLATIRTFPYIIDHRPSWLQLGRRSTPTFVQRYTSPPVGWFHSAAARTTSLPTFTAIAPSASQFPSSC